MVVIIDMPYSLKVYTYCSYIAMQHLTQHADKNYQCEDGRALITDNNWVLLCPPNDEIVVRSSSVLNTKPALSSSTIVGED